MSPDYKAGEDLILLWHGDTLLPNSHLVAVSDLGWPQRRHDGSLIGDASLHGDDRFGALVGMH